VTPAEESDFDRLPSWEAIPVATGRDLGWHRLLADTNLYTPKVFQRQHGIRPKFVKLLG
jgi:hypothetical protein